MIANVPTESGTPSPRLVCIGFSHKTAPVDVRERHVIPASTMGEALTALRGYPAVKESLMLQTCGRLEITPNSKTTK